MSTDLDARAAALFMAALDHDSAERTSFLDNACGAGTPLRLKVDALLSSDGAAGGFLDATMLASMTTVPFDPATALVGQEVGRYRIDRLIGCGGMGAVYEATQESPRRTVALKLMRSGIVSASLLRRFEYEAQVLAQLRHPNVVQIYEAGVHARGADGRVPYFAMEYIPDARSILEFAREHDLHTRERLELFIHVCDAVHHGHQKGVIHRDLKPGNILVDAAGQPKVIDFGVARAIASDLMVTTVHSGVGQIIGTLRYMSPEQCDADPLAIDIRSDVYALGVVLYELLTAKLPYDVTSGPIAYALHVIRDVPPARLSVVDRTLRGDIETIVLKCLAKERERRYQGAGELAADIRRYLDRRPIAARPPTLFYQIRTFARRNKVLVAGVVAVAISLVAGIAGTSWGLVRAREQARIAQFQTRAARFQAYVADVIGADAALQANDPITARERLSAAPAEYRNWEWRYLSNCGDASIQTITLNDPYPTYSIALSPDGQFVATSLGRVLRASTGETIRTLIGHETPIQQVAWSPKSDRIASAGGLDRTARTWDALSGRSLITFSGTSGHVDAVMSVSFSPDGRCIATGSRDNSVKLWDVTTGACLATLPGHKGEVVSVAFSPDGRRLVSGSLDCTVRIWSLDERRAVQVLVGHTAKVCAVAFDERGMRVLSAALDGTARIWDAHTGAQSLVLHAPTKSDGQAAFSPDGRIVATAGGDRVIRLWDGATGELQSTLRGHSAFICALTFTPDGKRLASCSEDYTIKMWDPATVPVPLVLGRENQDADIAFNPDGKLLASASYDTTVRLWDVDSGEETATLEGHEGRVLCVSFALDGSTIASSGSDRTVRLWDVVDGHERRVLRGPTNDVWAVAYSPDGRYLAASADGASTVWDLRAATDRPSWATHDSASSSIAFSPDSSRFADTSIDKNVRIWRCQTGELIRVLKGSPSSSGNHRVAFSPDGRRIASASDDRTLRVWDAESGEDIHLITGLKADPLGLAYYPDSDGSRLAVSFKDGTVALWDTREWQTVLTLRCDLSTAWMGPLEFDKGGQRLACGSSVNKIWLWDVGPLAARTAATAMARALRMEAEPIVAKLFSQGRTRAEAIDELTADKALSSGVREAAIRLVRTRAGRLDELSRTAWDIVRDPKATPGQYQRARAIANSLVHLNPNNALYLTTSGLARFRTGDYEGALAALTRARTVDTPADHRTHVAMQAFLAMVQFKLGDRPTAEATLADLRAFVADPAIHADDQVAGFLKEAESLVDPR